MKWITNNGVTTAGDYQIVRDTRDYSIWIRKDQRWTLLTRGVPTLDTAKIYVATHMSDNETRS
jgi:hypothetical protein